MRGIKIFTDFEIRSIEISNGMSMYDERPCTGAKFYL